MAEGETQLLQAVLDLRMCPVALGHTHTQTHTLPLSLAPIYTQINKCNNFFKGQSVKPVFKPVTRKNEVTLKESGAPGQHFDVCWQVLLLLLSFSCDLVPRGHSFPTCEMGWHGLIGGGLAQPSSTILSTESVMCGGPCL